MDFRKNFKGGKKHVNIGNRGILSKEEINQSSFDTAWRNNMAGITARLESEEYLLVGDSMVNIAKILSEESEMSLDVLAQYRGDIKQIENGSTSLLKSVDAPTLRDLESYIPITAMSELAGNLKRAGLDRQVLNGLVSAKVLYKLVGELEEMKKIMIQGYEEGHMSEELAKEIGVFGFGVIEPEAPQTTLVTKKGGKFGRNLEEEGSSPFGSKGFNKSNDNGGGFGKIGNTFGGKKASGGFGGGSFGGKKASGSFGGGFGKSPSTGGSFGGNGTFGKKSTGKFGGTGGGTFGKKGVFGR